MNANLPFNLIRPAPLSRARTNFNMDELYSLSLTEAVRRLSSGEMTSEAYTRSLLARIDHAGAARPGVPMPG